MVRSHRPGGGRRRRNPAGFYWHPCRFSASVASPRLKPAPIDRPKDRRCALRCTSPTFPRILEPSCGYAPAWGLRRTLSRRPGFPHPTALFAAPEWITSIPWRWSGTVRGRLLRHGGGRQGIASFFSPLPPYYPTSITLTGQTMCCCSAANQRACRRRSTPPPMPGWSSRCGPAGARSMSPSPPRWPPAKRCGRPAEFSEPRLAL